jgi:deoxyribodipyrimidine photo-lyase
MIEATRCRRLNDREQRRGRYVLYWMQQSQCAWFSPALAYAIEIGNRAGLPVLVAFGLMDDYPDANLRHYRFMLEGLQDGAGERTWGELSQRGGAQTPALRPSARP